MKVIGIDPGLATVGIGVIESEPEISIIDWCLIETSSNLILQQRLYEIESDLVGILGKYKPDLASVEQLFFKTNRKTAIDVAQARGVIVVSLERSGIPIVEPTPLELKSVVTGDGRADKKQMQNMLKMMFGEECPSDDAVDALGLAIYGAITRGSLLTGIRKSV